MARLIIVEGGGVPIMVGGCGTGCDHSQMWWSDTIMQDVEHVKWRGAMLCKMWCDAGCGGAHNVADMWCDLKCGVEYMECGVM